MGIFCMFYLRCRSHFVEEFYEFLMAGIEVSESSPFLNVVNRRINSESDCCIICVGSTGSGKSSTISIMTGQHIPTGDSVTSVTTECQLYSNLMISDAASWLDTVGWEDRKKE